ncbi:hypothetical protein D3C75_1275090 [compost metagenome]
MAWNPQSSRSCSSFPARDAVGRKEYVVDLRGAVGCAQGDVVQAAVGLLIQLPMGKQSHQEFANMALVPGRFK